MITFTKTRHAADYISHHTSSDLARSRALVLLKRLGVAEAALAATNGDPGLVHSLLRGLVLTVRELPGPHLALGQHRRPRHRRLHRPGRRTRPATPRRARRTP